MARVLQLLAFVVLLALMFGCGGVTSSTSEGTLAFVLADAPSADITEVNITVDRVEAHINGRWVTITAPQESYNLLDLTQQAAPLGPAGVPAGTYTQVRLFISNASVVDDEGTHDVLMPSVDETGIKLNVDYTVEPGKITTILLDFNVDRSLVSAGGAGGAGQAPYLLRPVIEAVVEVLSGTIEGTVTMGGEPVEGVEVTAVYTEGDNYPIGTEVNTAVSDENGMFKIWALMPGSFTITFSSSDETGVAEFAASVEGVVVTADRHTPMADVTLEVVVPDPRP